MHNILNQTILPKLAILQNRWFIPGIITGVTVIVVLALVLIIMKRRKSKKSANVNLTDAEELSNKKPEENYEFITERIKRVEKKYKSILFASVEPGALPITIPVNVAIGLAKSKKRCLLIDLDLKRDAIARAFELNTRKNDFRPTAVRTEFENLWVWPGHNFTQLKQMNIKAIVKKALDKFDFILINTPSLVSSPDHRQIVSAAQAAFICTKNASEATRLAELIKPSNCMVIGHIQIPQ
jgi:Mrp family chromosome partitioning ATPase